MSTQLAGVHKQIFRELRHLLLENGSGQLKKLSNCVTHSRWKDVLELKEIIILEVNTAIFINHIQS